MKIKTKLRICALFILMVFVLTSCTKDYIDDLIISCDPNEVLTVYSSQGVGLVILDVLYQEDRDCNITKIHQEQINNCTDPNRICTWN